MSSHFSEAVGQDGNYKKDLLKVSYATARKTSTRTCDKPVQK